jgi:hypothetical protein
VFVRTAAAETSLKELQQYNCDQRTATQDPDETLYPVSIVKIIEHVFSEASFLFIMHSPFPTFLTITLFF